MPMVSNLRNPALKNRHWEMIENVLQNKIPGREEHVKESSWSLNFDFIRTLLVTNIFLISP